MLHNKVTFLDERDNMTKSISLVYLSYKSLMMANSGTEADNNLWKSVQIKITSWILMSHFYLGYIFLKFEAQQRITLFAPVWLAIISIVTS